MICSVMQPYLFPYIGYYQLVYASDIFIFYDDVNYITRGYINRNNILVDGKSNRFTLPVLGASRNKKINDLNYSNEFDKVLKTISLEYSKSPYFNNIYPLIKTVFEQENRSILNINKLSIQIVFEYLGINRRFLVSSEIDCDRGLGRAERLIELSKINGCSHYINSPGGKELYGKKYFEEFGVKLSFIESEINEYKQKNDSFVPYLSIIDILMNCSKDQVIEMLKNYRLT